MNRFKNLNIWKRAVVLATEVYKITQRFPDEEKYGLISQLRRCVVSISSNIAEGAGRNTDKDFKRFLSIAYGSSYELETQIIIATNLEFIDELKSEKLSGEINELQKMIYSFSVKIGKH
jgi:four helix bundle protein